MVDRDRLIGDLQDLHEMLLVDLEDSDEKYISPTQEQMNEFGEWSAQTYYREFGSWNNALECANLKLNQCHKPDKSKLINELISFSKDVNGSPTAKEMDQDGPHSSLTYHVKFGSWNNALNQAGLQYNREYTNRKSLLDEIQNVSEIIGGTPSVSDMNEHGKWSVKPYKDEFGSWNGALTEAGFEPIREHPLKSEWSGDIEDYYGDSWPEMRQRVTQRDGSKCRICGSCDEIHVHHIKPRRLFEDPDESNKIENLISLCVSCHGKFEGRWIECNHKEFEEKAKNVHE